METPRDKSYQKYLQINEHEPHWREKIKKLKKNIIVIFPQSEVMRKLLERRALILHIMTHNGIWQYAMAQ